MEKGRRKETEADVRRGRGATAEVGTVEEQGEISFQDAQISSKEWLNFEGTRWNHCRNLLL